MKQFFNQTWVVSTLVIVGIVLIGGLYYKFSKTQTTDKTPETTGDTPSEE